MLFETSDLPLGLDILLLCSKIFSKLQNHINWKGIKEILLK